MKAEDAKLPGAGISLTQCPRKCVAEKGKCTGLSDIGREKDKCNSGRQDGPTGRRSPAKIILDPVP